MTDANRTTSPVTLARFKLRYSNFPGLDKPIQPLTGRAALIQADVGVRSPQTSARCRPRGLPDPLIVHAVEPDIQVLSGHGRPLQERRAQAEEQESDPVPVERVTPSIAASPRVRLGVTS